MRPVKLTVLAALVVGSAIMSAHTRPAVDIRYPNRTYEAAVSTVREIPFRNFRYFLNGTSYQLRNGKAAVRKHLFYIDVDLGNVWYFDVKDGQPQRALVSLGLTEAAGSSSSTGFLQVFKIEDGHPLVTQEFSYDLQARGAGESFDSTSLTLIIRARSDDDSAHCCAKNIDIAVFKWRDDKFVLQQSRTVPIEDESRR